MGWNARRDDGRAKADFFFSLLVALCIFLFSLLSSTPARPRHALRFLRLLLVSQGKFRYRQAMARQCAITLSRPSISTVLPCDDQPPEAVRNLFLRRVAWEADR